MKSKQQEAIEQVFTRFYNESHSQLYGFALKHTEDIQLAEEIVQQAFIRLWKKMEALNTPGAYQAYLFTTVRNLIFDEYRRKIAEQEAALVFWTNVETSDDKEESLQESMTRLKYFIQQLPDRQRQVLEMHKFQGLSYNEIASRLSISVSTVEKHIIAALRTLRQNLSKIAYLYLIFFF